MLYAQRMNRISARFLSIAENDHSGQYRNMVNYLRTHQSDFFYNEEDNLDGVKHIGKRYIAKHENVVITHNIKKLSLDQHIDFELFDFDAGMKAMFIAENHQGIVFRHGGFTENLGMIDTASLTRNCREQRLHKEDTSLPHLYTGPSLIQNVTDVTKGVSSMRHYPFTQMPILVAG